LANHHRILRFDGYQGIIVVLILAFSCIFGEDEDEDEDE